jgi:hypothetical protein
MNTIESLVRRRFLLRALVGTLIAACSTTGVVEQAHAESTPEGVLDLEERRRLRRELRQAHRERLTDSDGVRGRHMPHTDSRHPSRAHPREAVDHHPVQESHWNSQASPGVRHSGSQRMSLSEDERALLREQLRALRRDPKPASQPGHANQLQVPPVPSN